MAEERLRVTGRLDEPDEEAARLFIAVGRAVFMVAGLEHNLRLEITRLLVERNSATGVPQSLKVDRELTRIGELTGGQLLRELRQLDLPAGLDERLGDAINRRNEIVHHLHEDPEVVRAMAGGGGMDAVVKRIDQLALDCAELSVELGIFAAPKLEARLGKSQAELLEILKARDPKTVEDPRERRQLEAIQALGDVELPNFQDLIENDPAAQ
jgi:hypothetical protein